MTDFLSYQLYPKVFEDAAAHHAQFGNVMRIPTKNFFYGMEEDEEITVELDRGKTLLITFLSAGKPDEDGIVTLFFKVNGQTRNVLVKDTSVKVDKKQHQKIDKEEPKQIGAPLQGSIREIMVKKGDKVNKNQALFTIEAMKMETTVTANVSGKVASIELSSGEMVYADDLVIVLE